MDDIEKRQERNFIKYKNNSAKQEFSEYYFSTVKSKLEDRSTNFDKNMDERVEGGRVSFWRLRLEHEVDMSMKNRSYGAVGP
uniref:Uncharacterized protein n=1 Tax=Tanacetum cinerariifolium TaxID=118510 RepID=A0A6L2K7G1_TANCI|nr:hypothetical protein [Tanacetum cinerariifolium]